MKDNEIAGTGNHNTAEFWEYDTRLAARWNTDPVIDPSQSHYAVFDRNPIAKSDVMAMLHVAKQQCKLCRPKLYDRNTPLLRAVVLLIR